MSGVLHLECRSCGSAIAAEHINIDRLVAMCSACSAVFGFDLNGGAAMRRDRSKIAMPKSVSVENQGGDLVIVHRWRSPIVVAFLVVFAVGWNSIAWSMFLVTLSEETWFISAFLSIFLMVGAGVGYLALAMLLNSSEIRVSRRELTVKHGPMPFPGAVAVDPGDIEQVWVEQKISHSSSSKGRSSTSVSYPVCMRLKDGTRKVLLRNVTDSELALFVEQQIETHLGIEDQAVRGEF